MFSSWVLPFYHFSIFMTLPLPQPQLFSTLAPFIVVVVLFTRATHTFASLMWLESRFGCLSLCFICRYRLLAYLFVHQLKMSWRLPFVCCRSISIPWILLYLCVCVCVYTHRKKNVEEWEKKHLYFGSNVLLCKCQINLWLIQHCESYALWLSLRETMEPCNASTRDRDAFHICSAGLMRSKTKSNWNFQSLRKMYGSSYSCYAKRWNIHNACRCAFECFFFLFSFLLLFSFVPLYTTSRFFVC